MINEKAMQLLLALLENLINDLDQKETTSGEHFDRIREITDVGVTIARLSESRKPGTAEAAPGDD